MVYNLFLHLMHTEDDTFAALRRIPFTEMRNKMGKAKVSIMFGGPDIDLDELCRVSGWSREEYEFELKMSVANFEGLIIKPNANETYKVTHDRSYITKYRG